MISLNLINQSKESDAFVPKLNGHSPLEFSQQDWMELCRSLRLPTVHARRLVSNVYREMMVRPWCDDRLPTRLRRYCDENMSSIAVDIISARESAHDRSVKLLVRLRDGAEVESVIMPESRRVTLCVSSQYGCAQGCIFCHTGRMGLLRNLSAGEIIGQLWAATKWMIGHPEWCRYSPANCPSLISNIVFMGMGEPLDNVESVSKAVTIMTDPIGLSIGPRHVSVSTAGHLDGMESFCARHPQIPIAISLHAVNEKLRAKIMPITARWNLGELRQAIARINELSKRRRSVLVQYTLLAGVNDSEEHARELVNWLRGLRVKINLIPFNEIGPARFRAPDSETVQKFRDILFASSLRTMVRYSKGQDISAACGQLVTSLL